MDAFNSRKAAVLDELASSEPDKSRKGGVDLPIADLIERVNGHEGFYTTSSCSGRISLFLEPTSAQRLSSKTKGGHWLLVSHGKIDPLEAVRAVEEAYSPGSGLLHFRFEPFILAVECLTANHGQRLVSAAIGAGFRESGITTLSKRVIVAIRSSIRLEVPVADHGALLVPPAFLSYLAETANHKMDENHKRIARFLQAFIQQVERDPSLSASAFQSEASSSAGSGARWHISTARGSTPKAGPGRRRSNAAARENFTTGRTLPAVKPLSNSVTTGGGKAQAEDGAGDDDLMQAVAARQVALLQRIRALEAALGIAWGASSSKAKRAARAKGIVSPLNENVPPGSLRATTGILDPVWAADETNNPSSEARGSDSQMPEGCQLVQGKKASEQVQGTKHPTKENALPCSELEGNCLSEGWDLPFPAQHSSAAELARPAAPAESGLDLRAINDSGTLRRGEGRGRVQCTDSCEAEILEAASRELEGNQASPAEEGGHLIAQPLNFFPEPKKVPQHLLRRWGHTSVTVPAGTPGVTQILSATLGPSVLIFGGYGGSGASTRLNDIVLLDCSANWACQVAAGSNPPSPRVGHTASLVRCQVAATEDDSVDSGVGPWQLVVIGGREVPGVPLGDVHVLDLATWQWRCPPVSGVPFIPRFRHCAAAVRSKIYVFGGLGGPHLPIAALQVLDTATWRWSAPVSDNRGCPAARHSAAMATIGRQVYLHGGRDERHIFGDLFRIGLEDMTWIRVGLKKRQLAPQLQEEMKESEAEVAAFSHTLTPLGGELLLLLGGCPAARGSSSAHIVDVADGRATQLHLALPPRVLPVRHTANWVGDKLAVIGGGAFCFAFGSVYSPPFALSLSSGAANFFSLPSPPGNRGARNRGYLQGQPVEGASCSLSTQQLHPAAGADKVAPGNAVKTGTSQTTAAAPAASKPRNAEAFCKQSAGQATRFGWALVVPLGRAKIVKDSMKSKGLVDLSRHVAPLGSCHLAIPVKDEAHRLLYAQEKSHSGKLHSAAPGDTLQDSVVANRVAPGHKDPEGTCEAGEREEAQLAPPRSGADGPGAGKAHADVVVERLVADVSAGARAESAEGDNNDTRPESWVDAAQHDRAGVRQKLPPRDKSATSAEPAILEMLDLQWLELPAKRRHVAPGEALQVALQDLLQSHGLPAAPVDEIPTRWERLGDLVVLPAGSLESPNWRNLGAILWQTVAAALSANRVARQAAVAATGTRDSRLQMLTGGGSWVEVRENGILYAFDAAACMFSSGNVTEKLRVANFSCRGEIVLDLFAGIGYYTLPYLLKAGASHVVACEWNPHALSALRHNLVANGVAAKCTVLEGDNRQTAPKGIANRVNLGLLPSSEDSWHTAVMALRPEGGMLHIHGNVLDSEELLWAARVVEDIAKLAKTAAGCHWAVELVHLERVKWYAPHIRHLVADIRCFEKE